MFYKIFLSIFIILITTDVAIFFFFIRKWTKNIYLRLLWFLPSIALFSGILVNVFFRFAGLFGSIFVLVYLAITLPKVIFAIFSLLDLPFRFLFKKWKVYPFTLLSVIINIAILWILLYGSIIGKTRFQVKEVEFFSSDLPQSFAGYKIVHISDLHLGNWQNGHKTMQKLTDLINRQQPNIVAVTGDIVNRFAFELEGYDTIFSQINAPDGIYSVLGNHDYGTYYQWESKEQELENFNTLKQHQTDMNFKLLNNENAIIVKGEDSIAVIGVENASSHHRFIDNSDLPKALQGTENIKFKILLSHDPSLWRKEVVNTDINLMLSGHTHGAQLVLGCLPIASNFYPEWSGLYLEGYKGLYVNMGIGYVGIPFRYGALPEVTVIRLQTNN